MKFTPSFNANTFADQIIENENHLLFIHDLDQENLLAVANKLFNQIGEFEERNELKLADDAEYAYNSCIDLLRNRFRMDSDSILTSMQNIQNSVQPAQLNF